MPQYRKKPVVIEAFQLPHVDSLPDNLCEWAIEHGLIQMDGTSPELKFKDDPDGSGGLIIKTLEGDMKARPLDWIIKGVKGEFYPCKPDIFEATYERV